MKSAVWGPSFWQFFQSVAFHNNDKPATIEFLKLFRWLLPCRYCRESFQGFAEKLQPSLTPVDYVYELHTLVNQKLEKPNLEYSTYMQRLIVFRAPLAEADIRNLFLILVANYDSNPEPEQQKAFLLFWRGLPDMIQEVLPALATTLRKCQGQYLLPGNRPWTGKMLQDRLSCSFRDLQRVALIHS